ncbi:hypothetical protein CR513_19263, partial [Mucuna pruriens]
MGETSEDWAPKSKQMRKYIMRLEERLERLGREHKDGLDSVEKDTSKRHEKHERYKRQGRKMRVREGSKREKLDTMKCKIPSFFGDCKLDSYLNWELKVDQIFECFDYHERMKEPLQQAPKAIYQQSMSVEEYHKEMEIDLIRAQIMESREATIARFLRGLNREIQDIVEVQCYTTLEELVHQDTKVELQLKRRKVSRKPYPSSTWKGKEGE